MKQFIYTKSGQSFINLRYVLKMAEIIRHVGQHVVCNIIK